MNNELKLINQSDTLKNFVKNKTKTNSCGLIVSKDERLLKAISVYTAMAMACKKENPCFECFNCQKIITNNAIEVFSYPKFKDDISVKDVEEFVNSLIKRPMDFDKKIYIFNRIDRASIEAQNKLLKSMEEFPLYARLIFTATNTRQVLPTILSRVTTNYVPMISFNEYEKILNQFNGENSLPLNAIYDLSEGNLFSGKDMLADENIKEIYDNCLDILSQLNSENISRYSQIINKSNLTDYLKILSLIISKMLMGKQNLIQDFQVINQKFTLKALIKIADLVHYSNKKIKSNTNEQSIIDNLLIGIMEAKL